MKLSPPAGAQVAHTRLWSVCVALAQTACVALVGVGVVVEVGNGLVDLGVGRRPENGWKDAAGAGSWSGRRRHRWDGACDEQAVVFGHASALPRAASSASAAVGRRKRKKMHALYAAHTGVGTVLSGRSRHIRYPCCYLQMYKRRSAGIDPPCLSSCGSSWQEEPEFAVGLGQPGPAGPSAWAWRPLGRPLGGERALSRVSRVCSSRRRWDFGRPL